MAVLALALLAFAPASNAGAQGAHDALVAKHATANGVPESLVRRVIRIESRGNARAISKGNYGLMQIRLGTARAMGYRGSAKGLLDADTNLTYAVKYLAGAYRAAGCNPDRAIRYYQRGYHRVRRARCPVPRPAPTQTASASIEKRLTPQRAEAAEPQSTGTGTGDVLKPKVVRTVSVPSFKEPSPRPLLAVPPAPRPVAPPPVPSPRPGPLRAESNGEAKSDAVAVSVPAPPKTDAKSQPVGATAVAVAGSAPVDAASARNAKPAEVPPPQAVARLEPEAVPLPPPRQADAQPAENKAKPASRAPSKRAHGRKRKADDASLVTLLKKLVTPDKKARSRKRADNPSVYRHSLN